LARVFFRAGALEARFALPGYHFVPGLVAAILRKRPAYVIAFLDAAFVVAPDVAFVAARGDQFAFACWFFRFSAPVVFRSRYPTRCGRARFHSQCPALFCAMAGASPLRGRPGSSFSFGRHPSLAPRHPRSVTRAAPSGAKLQWLCGPTAGKKAASQRSSTLRIVRRHPEAGCGFLRRERSARSGGRCASSPRRGRRYAGRRLVADGLFRVIYPALSRFNGACPNSPAADRLTPARNAGTSTMVTCASARSRSAAAILMMKIHGSGIAVSIQDRTRANTRWNRRNLRRGPRRFRSRLEVFFGGNEPRLIFRRDVTNKIGPLENMRCGRLARNCRRRSPTP
jgi:hypothetical protein